MLGRNTTSRVRSKNNALERMVFKYLNSEGVYYQKHYTRAPGNPDIALPRKKRAVFINGDFWHGRDFEKRRPQLSEYWIKKVSGNLERDTKNIERLTTLGWKCLVVWESDLIRKSTGLEHLRSIKIFLTE